MKIAPRASGLRLRHATFGIGEGRDVEFKDENAAILKQDRRLPFVGIAVTGEQSPRAHVPIDSVSDRVRRSVVVAAARAYSISPAALSDNPLTNCPRSASGMKPVCFMPSTGRMSSSLASARDLCRDAANPARRRR